jgi:formylmethanofuran dehydrogenase subunit A
MSVLAFIPTHNDGQKRVISGEVDNSCAHVGYHAAITGNSLPTFRDNIPVTSSRMKNKKKETLKMGPASCSETSVRNYHYPLRKSTEELSSQRWTELSVSTLKGSDILGYDVL